MTSEQNKAIVRRFLKAFESNDQAALAELLAPDLQAYAHGSPLPQDRDSHLQMIRAWNEAIRTSFTVDEQVAEGDQVATRVTMDAVHSGGDFQGLPPTGRQIRVGGMSIERVRDGKIVERHVEANWLGIMQQLGLIPGGAAQPA